MQVPLNNFHGIHWDFCLLVDQPEFQDEMRHQNRCDDIRHVSIHVRTHLMDVRGLVKHQSML